MKQKNNIVKGIRSLFICICICILATTCMPAEGSDINSIEPSVSSGDVSGNNISETATPEPTVEPAAFDVSDNNIANEEKTSDASENNETTDIIETDNQVSDTNETDNQLQAVSGNDIFTEDVSDNNAMSFFGLSNILYTDENGTEYTADDLYETIDLSAAADGSVVMYVFNDGLGVIDGVGIMASTDENTLSTVKDILTKVVMAEDSDVEARGLSELFLNHASIISIDLSKLNTENTDLLKLTFNNCTNLQYLNISNFNTSKVTNMYGMFSGCSKLTALDVSKFDTSNVEMMNYAFTDCSSLTELDVSNFNTSKAITMYAMFSGCSNVTTLDVSDFDTSNVADMKYMFTNCSKLTELNVSNFNTSKVTTMYGMFSGCSKLTALDVSKFNTSNVVDMKYMFTNCSKLTELNVSNFNTSKVTNMSHMFSGCSLLKTLDIKNFDTTKVTNTTRMLRDCSSLTDIYAPNIVVSEIALPYEMYNENGEACTNIAVASESITYSKTKPVLYTDEITGIEYYKKNASYVLDLSLNQDKSVVMYIFDDGMGIIDGVGTMANADDTTLSTVNSVLTKVVMSGDSSVIAGDLGSFFYNCSNLTYADLSNLDTSNTNNMSCMFQNCSNLKTVIANNWNTSKVESVANMFAGCTFLTTIDTTNWDTSSIIMMSTMFNGCSNLVTLDVSNWDTSNVTSMVAMFKNCSSLTFLDVSNWNTSKVTLMNSMFDGCKSLTVLDVSGFDTSKVTSINGMFNSCSKVATLDVSNFNTSGARNLANMFSNCHNLKELDLTNFITNSSVLTANFASNCPNLNKIILGENTTSFMSNAFTVSGTEKVITTVVDNSSQTALTMDWASMNRIGPFSYKATDGLTETTSLENVWEMSEEDQTACYDRLSVEMQNYLSHCYAVSLETEITPVDLEFTSHTAVPGYTGYQSFTINETATAISGAVSIEEAISANNSIYTYKADFCCCDASTPFYTYKTVIVKTSAAGFETEENVVVDHKMTVARNSALAGDVVYTLCYILTPSYTTTIPTTISLDAEGNGQYVVAANGSFPIGKVTIVPESSFLLQQDGKSPVEASVSQGQTEFSSGESTIGSIHTSGLSAGPWRGSFCIQIGTTYNKNEWESLCPN